MGNFQQESSNDPHRMEADYTSSFKRIGFDKMATDAEVRDNWVKNWLWPVGYKNASWLNRDAYYGDDGHTYPGFGLAQWTGPRGYKLFKFAKDNGLNWTDLSTQLDFFANANGEFKDRGLVSKMNAAGSVNDATYTFAKDYEGNTTLAQAERKQSANQFYEMYKDLDVDTPEIQTGEGLKGNGRASAGRGPRATHYGAGPIRRMGRGAVANLGYNAKDVTNQIAAMNSLMREQRETAQSQNNVETLARTITDAMHEGQSSGAGSEAVLQTISTTLSTMLELMVKITDKMDAITKATPQTPTSETNKAYAYQPTRQATYANGETEADDIGADLIRRLTIAH